MVTDIKKAGEVYTVYLTDITSGATARIMDFDKPPGAAFPQTFVGKPALYAWANSVGRDPAQFNFVEKEQSAAEHKAQSDRRLAELQAQLEKVKSNPEAAPKNSTTPSPVRDRALIHFQRLVDRYNWCADDLKATVNVQVAAVGDLLVELWGKDEIEAELDAIHDAASKPTVTVGKG